MSMSIASVALKCAGDVRRLVMSITRRRNCISLQAGLFHAKAQRSKEEAIQFASFFAFFAPLRELPLCGASHVYSTDATISQPFVAQAGEEYQYPLDVI